MKKILAMLLCLISVISACLMGGCNFFDYDPGNYKKKENGFAYYLIANDGRPSRFLHPAVGAVILGADEKEELMVPEKLGGYPVKKIGAIYSDLAGTTWEYGINAKNIKRIVINHDVGILSHGLREFDGCLVINCPIYFSEYFYRYYTMQLNFDINLMEGYEEEIQKLKEEQYEIKFDAVGGEKIAWATIIQKDNLLPEPKNPTKEGYEFAGWYVDEAYKTQWNFETDTVSKSMTLYAKWI